MNTSNDVTCQVQRVNVLNLNKLIRHIHSNDPVLKNLRGDQSIVAYDRKKGKAQIYNSSFSLGSLFGAGASNDIYLLDTYEELSVIQKCKLNSTRFKSLDIEVRFSMSVIKGSELILVEALARRDTPDKLLADFLFKWTASELRASADMAYADHAKFKEKVRNAVAEEGKRMGLKLIVAVNYLLLKPNSPMPMSLEVSERSIKIQPQQYNGFVYVDFEAVLIPDDMSSSSITTELALRDKDEFKALLKNTMQSFIRAKISYNELVSDLHTEVRKNLIQHWNNQLLQLNKGWRIADLKLSSSENLPVQFKREKLEISVLLKNAEVPLSNTVVLYLENAQLFRSSSITNLDQWIKDKLQKVAQKVLANILYAEFVSMFHKYSEEIKKELDNDVRMIGYKVELLLTSEPIGSDRLQVDFQLNEDEQLFETIINDKVRLNTIVSGRIVNLNHETWNKTLNPKTDLTKEIKTDILREIRNKILNVTPDNFYAKFNKEIPEEIKLRVKAVLINKYNLRPDVDVHIKIEHSQLKERLDQLSRGSLYTSVNLFKGAALYKVKFCILGVPIDRWELFANKKYADIEEEKSSIKEDLTIIVEKRLNQTATEKVAGNKFLVDLVQKLAEEAVTDIQKNRFLNIYIEKVTEETNEIGEILTEGNLNYIKNTIRMLQERRNQLRQEIEDAKKAEFPKLVKELEGELSEIEKTLNPGHSSEELDQLKSGNINHLLSNNMKGNDIAGNQKNNQPL